MQGFPFLCSTNPFFLIQLFRSILGLPSLGVSGVSFGAFPYSQFVSKSTPLSEARALECAIMMRDVVGDPLFSDSWQSPDGIRRAYERVSYRLKHLDQCRPRDLNERLGFDRLGEGPKSWSEADKEMLDVVVKRMISERRDACSTTKTFNARAVEEGAVTAEADSSSDFER